MTTPQGRRLGQALDRLFDDLERELTRDVVEEADQIVDDERSWVPVLTGELQSGIEAKTSTLGSNPRARVGVFDDRLWWAIYIEYGRKNADAQPFVLPAYMASRRRFPRRVRTTIREVVRRAQR